MPAPISCWQGSLAGMEVKGAERDPSKAVSKQLGFIYCLKWEVNPLPWAVRLALKQNLDSAPWLTMSARGAGFFPSESQRN